jgi:4-amino-4-deoxy-L-arabinose transferase-like glycosyltransferase
MLRELLENGSPLDIVATFIALALIAAMLLCLIFMIIGGITFILSAGNEEKIKKAMQTIRYSIIGLAVVFISFFAVAWISKLLAIPFNLSFATIVDLMSQIFSVLKG